MEDLTELRQRLRTNGPSLGTAAGLRAVYGPVLSYMDRRVIRFDEDDGLTSAMVNNYTKSGLVPGPPAKSTTGNTLAYLTAICVLKRVMSTRDMDLLIKQELQGERSVADGYAAFCESLDKALNITADEMELYLDESTPWRTPPFTSPCSATPQALPATATCRCCGSEGRPQARKRRAGGRTAARKKEKDEHA